MCQNLWPSTTSTRALRLACKERICSPQRSPRSLQGREGSVGTFEYMYCGKPPAEATRPSTAIVRLIWPMCRRVPCYNSRGVLILII